MLKKMPFYVCQSSKHPHMLMCLKACSIFIIELACHEMSVFEIIYGPAPVCKVVLLLLLVYTTAVVEKGDFHITAK